MSPGSDDGVGAAVDVLWSGSNAIAMPASESGGREEEDFAVWLSGGQQGVFRSWRTKFVVVLLACWWEAEKED